jgi:hypothetical protein
MYKFADFQSYVRVWSAIVSRRVHKLCEDILEGLGFACIMSMRRTAAPADLGVDYTLTDT